MKSQNNLENQHFAKLDQYGLKIENLMSCSLIKYKLSTICLTLLLVLHVIYFLKDSTDYLNSFHEKNKLVFYIKIS